MSQMTYLNNSRGWLYDPPHNGLEEVPPNQFGDKTLFFFIHLYR